jgi:hypothetical protein
MEVRLEEPESLGGVLVTAFSSAILRTHQKRAIHRFFAQVYYEFLQCHGLIVDADEQVT